MVRLTLQGITRKFGEVTAVDDVSLKIARGELFFLLGPSGCGKTTVLRLIAGFYAPDTGSILFDDQDVTRTPPHRRNTGMVFQNYALWPHMSVWENVAYGLGLRKVPSSEQKDRVSEALRMVRMEAYGERSPNQLSGGQQQRVALARALVIQPGVVLLDEPLSNLDARLRLEMRDEIRRIHDETGMTMIYVTHDQKEALSMADRMAVMDMGAVAQTGDPRSIYTRPASAFVADFIGETNFVAGKLTRAETPLAVETAVGVIHSTAEPAESLSPGDEVVCSIRPETIRILKPDGTDGDDGADGGDENILAGVVQQTMYLGEHEQYSVRLDDGTLVKMVDHQPGRRRAGAGASIRLKYDAAQVVVLGKPG
ncbi:MAG: ABC transporter ATP-binding protein [Gemmatimonadetes bacterium]|nr:ABC transporter ATP-binding protein [Gemmatimonadota bacterium]